MEKVVISNQVTVKASELIESLNFHFKNKLPVMIAGLPGIGKTSIVKQVTKSLDYDFMLSHPVVKEPTDYKGLAAIVNNEAKFLPFGDLKKLINAQRETIVLIDDLAQSEFQTQAAIMQLVEAREIDGQKISDKVSFVLATNYRKNSAAARGVIDPLKGRMYTVLHLAADVDDWIDWAMRKSLQGSIIGFAKSNNKIHDGEVSLDLKGTYNPRSLHHVDEYLAKGLPEKLWESHFIGAIGEDFGSRLLAHLKFISKLPDYREILKNPKAVEVPTELDYRYVLSYQLAQHVTLETLRNMQIYLEGFNSPDLMTYAIRTAIKLKPELKKDSALISFATKYKDYLNV